MSKWSRAFRKPVRTIFQSESADCGLACLAMIANWHGSNISLWELRKKFGSSSRGMNLLQIKKYASELGFEAVAYQVELNEMRQLSLPCILHWNFTHFVVLERLTATGAYIVDPARGRQRLSHEAISNNFSGVALELIPTENKTRSISSQRALTLRDFANNSKGLVRSISSILFFSLALQAIVLALPIFLQMAIDRIVPSRDTYSLELLFWCFLGLALCLAAISWARALIVLHLSARLGMGWVKYVFEHLLSLPVSYFERRSLGDISSRMSSIQVIQRFFSVSFVEILMDGIGATITLIMLFFYSGTLSVIPVVAVAIYLVARAISYGALLSASEEQIFSASKQHSNFLESIRGIQSIKLGGGEHLRTEGWSNFLVSTTNSDIRAGSVRAVATGISRTIFGLERVLVVYFGILLVIKGDLSTGMLVAFISYKELFSTRISGVIDNLVEMRALRVHLDRLADVLFSSPEKITGTPVNALGGTISVRDIWYRHGVDSPWILEGCSFEVAAGECIAFSGISGTGKTTLVKILLGLIEPDHGDVFYDGKSLKEVDQREFRSLVGVVMQEDRLFAGTIADNIRFFDPRISLADVMESASSANMHDDIMAMTMNYHTLIGDMGTSLSGGQRQRLLLARALCKRPSILFLDEASSHLDAAAELAINRKIAQLKITRIVVAHRNETLAIADRVLQLSHGKVTMVRSGFSNFDATNKT